jgi:hypothetical protein
MILKNKKLACLIGFICIVAFSGCAPTVQVRNTEVSGFLKNSSQLVEGKGDQALLVYINPEAHFAKYDKVVIAPVSVWRSADSDLDDIPNEELQQMVDYLDNALRENLKEDFTVVERAEPGSMTVRVGLTEADDSEIVMDTISNVLPPAIALNLIKKVATGTSAFVGRARIELEILDGITGRRLLALVDERAGSKSFKGKFDKWDDVHQAFNYWAKKTQTRLVELRKEQP